MVVVEGTLTEPVGAGLFVLLHVRQYPLVLLQVRQSTPQVVHEVSVVGLTK